MIRPARDAVGYLYNLPVLRIYEVEQTGGTAFSPHMGVRNFLGFQAPCTTDLIFFRMKKSFLLLIIWRTFFHFSTVTVSTGDCPLFLLLLGDVKFSVFYTRAKTTDWTKFVVLWIVVPTQYPHYFRCNTTAAHIAPRPKEERKDLIAPCASELKKC